ncbi:Bifunctional xylanase/deacetylase precursor [Aquisphaera giovannonii]|uniref:Bifunctional xylanase/deacetylase n=1 Tax=Aquisphaera giovannonii TaxID=406548 RepID=A0A5B9W470_9BACT|nr:polysaccharide deacetylase family protein [Aquisphaera giovannonii]QEH34770.1 Bifunctional xylanase/deacetylase precursor [Aquisphaera giovannonii]
MGGGGPSRRTSSGGFGCWRCNHSSANINILCAGLPPGTLCLTYDDGPGRGEGPRDGPGPRTADLGAYLHSEGIRAAFFAVGRAAERHPDILAGLRSLGHLVANHTYDHASRHAFVERGGDAHEQLARTDAAIRPHVDGPVTFFHAPYGDWWLCGRAESNVAAPLNRSPLAPRYPGPIGRDVDGLDVGFWRDDRPAEACAGACLEAIGRVGRGIVLMHDSTADIEEIRRRNRALGLARALIPELRRRGYRFVRLDEIPRVASMCRGAGTHVGLPRPASGMPGGP